MKLIRKSKLVDNKSKFFGRLYTIDGLDDVKKIQKKHRKKFRKAVHHCGAAISGKEYIFKNNGEVGHPGKVIWQVMKGSNLSSHCIMISRKFGGIKLGPGGVARAFRDCARLLTKDL